MSDAAGDEPVVILAGELVAIGCAGRVDCPVGVTFHGDGWHRDDRKRGQPFFEIVISPLTVRQAKPPAIIVHHDVNVVRVLKEAAVRLYVASSKFHFGEAWCKMNLLNSSRYFP